MPSVLCVLQPPDGGVAEHVLGLAGGLRARGWHVHVATTPESLIDERLADAGAEVHVVPMRRGPHPSDARAIRLLRSLDRRIRPDIVAAHSSKAGALVRASLPGRRRLVYTPHGPSFAAPFPPARRAVYRAVEQALVPRTGAIIAVCRWEAGVMAGLTGLRERVHVVHNGVPRAPRDRADERVLSFARGRPVAGLIACLRPEKNPVGLVRAATRLPPSEGCVAIIGDGALEDAVRREIDALGVGDRVILLPFSGRMATHLAALDLFALPSASEAFPLGVLEAMQCGLPVLATRVGGVEEAVTEETGRLVAPGDPAVFGDALRDLLADTALRRRLGAAAKESAERCFGIDRMVEATREVYTRMLCPSRF